MLYYLFSTFHPTYQSTKLSLIYTHGICTQILSWCVFLYKYVTFNIETVPSDAIVDTLCQYKAVVYHQFFWGLTNYSLNWKSVAIADDTPSKCRKASSFYEKSSSNVHIHFDSSRESGKECEKKFVFVRKLRRPWFALGCCYWTPYWLCAGPLSTVQPWLRTAVHLEPNLNNYIWLQFNAVRCSWIMWRNATQCWFKHTFANALCKKLNLSHRRPCNHQ